MEQTTGQPSKTQLNDPSCCRPTSFHPSPKRRRLQVGFWADLDVLEIVWSLEWGEKGRWLNQAVREKYARDHAGG